MSKGYAVYPLMKQPREVVIDEALIRDCISLPQAVTTDEERMQIVGNRNGALFREKTLKEAREMDLRRVLTLVLSYRRIGFVDNLYGLSNLTKLCLDNNHIAKIENLSHLTKLQTLDLSYNSITVIEGLEALTELDSLSLYANSITVVQGLDTLTKLTALSLGKNAIEALDSTATCLHRLKCLRVLTLKDCRVASASQYRARLLAFVPTLRFLDGRVVQKTELAQAREDQRENLLPVDEQDERESAEAKAAAELESTRAEYERYNCPNDATLYDELLRLTPEDLLRVKVNEPQPWKPEERSMAGVLRSDMLIVATKEILDHNQSDFNAAAKKLADAMKEIRTRRDADEAAHKTATVQYSTANVSASRDLIKAFEKRMKTVFHKGVNDTLDTKAGTPEALAALRDELMQLQSELVEREADMYDTNEGLNTATLAKWKRDGVDVLLQSAFETFFKLEGDLQISVRHALDAVSEHRMKKDHGPDDVLLHIASGRETVVAALLDSKEEYQKLLVDWFEMRRKRLEEKEMYHLKSEERLLQERASNVLRCEQDRHRNRLADITEYIEQMSDLIDSS